MAKLLLLTNSRHSSAEVLPSLALLQHQVRILPAEVSVLVDAPSIDLLLVDARRDLGAMKNLTRLLTSTGVGAPVMVVVTPRPPSPPAVNAVGDSPAPPAPPPPPPLVYFT